MDIYCVHSDDVLTKSSYDKEGIHICPFFHYTTREEIGPSQRRNNEYTILYAPRAKRALRVSIPMARMTGLHGTFRLDACGNNSGRVGYECRYGINDQHKDRSTMKKVQLLLFALLLGLAISQAVPVSAAADAFQSDAFATTTTDLNLRAGPGTGNAIRRGIPAGAYVIVESGPYNGVWYEVSFAGSVGYVHGGYLTQRAVASRLSTAVATRNLNMRSGPGTTYGVVGVITSGMAVRIDPKPLEGGWRKVTANGVTGYVLSDAFNRTLGNGGVKRIVVDLSDQWLYVYEAGELVMTSPVSTGRDDFNTPLGTHRVIWKAALRTMKGTSNGITWEVPNVPHAMYLTETGVALHGTYWHKSFGSGVRLSHGCVNLPMDVAAVLYDWANIGTAVVVQE